MEVPNAGQNIFEDTEEQENYSDDATADKVDRLEIKKRNESYTRILERYYLYIDNMLDFKEEKRNAMFWGAIGILLIPILIFGIVLIIIVSKDLSQIENLVAFITAIGTTISAIYIVPTKIIEYLFSNEETQRIIEIIKNIQEYDKNVRDDIRERRKKENNT
ncbi:hypothetical protein [Thomasclavelia saccharogumia]|uniref:hypothetical protein n=1 Tax=Thomasclavelia saccharogumia TaxID=341225 RepID=UPI00068AD56F|nr:hypothetical protein [Thomasclavelia saccharogumia]